MKKILFLVIFVAGFSFWQTTYAGWVSGYFRNDGTYVDSYYRTEPNYYKWDNNSFDGDWNDAYNDRSWYRDYGYDPEPSDNDYPNYNYWDNSDTLYDSYDLDSSYDFSDNSYESYYDSYDNGRGY